MQNFAGKAWWVTAEPDFSPFSMASFVRVHATLCLMKNFSEADREQLCFDQIAEGFASALVTAQLIDEQMDESPTSPLQEVERLKVVGGSDRLKGSDVRAMPASRVKSFTRPQ